MESRSYQQRRIASDPLIAVLNPGLSLQLFRDIVFDLGMQLRQFRPVQSLLVMMRGMIAKVAGEQVVPLVQVIERGFEQIVGIQTSVVLISRPGSHE